MARAYRVSYVGADGLRHWFHAVARDQHEVLRRLYESAEVAQVLAVD